MGYRGVFGQNVTEKIIEKSRFLTYVSRIESEEEARAFLSRTRAEHAGATHVCYGYIADTLGNVGRYSEDGEPQGTAGLPIVGGIKAKNLVCTAAAVVRYFGGIKLGAGGLTRAYCGCAQEGLAKADIREYAACVRMTVAVNYGEVNAAMSFLERGGYGDYQKEFGESAAFTVAVREEKVSSFTAAAREYLNGRVKITEGEKIIFPFPVI